ncbi:MAG: 50S ribosomal protein L19e [Methanocellales archaeon]|nr:50S ribosomal protein L19e [Methanocellales archaeon]MDD3421081.1 50S ribosomal protein L19e [Methanocellales archaeon]MDD4898214.1 50S ribosomal protein L19e [Methanocellales archaeon]MDD5446681.1 50S ribosomal protein L19e [Methanocellales archaeon]
MDLSNQKRMAADILDVGVGRVWMDAEKAEDISTAITREDIRKLIADGIIKRKLQKGISRGRTRTKDKKRAYGHRKGQGSRRGAKGAKVSGKERWMNKIRALRKRLKTLRAEGTIDASTYRKLYGKATGGEFRDVSHLDTHLKTKRS